MTLPNDPLSLLTPFQADFTYSKECRRQNRKSFVSIICALLGTSTKRHGNCGVILTSALQHLWASPNFGDLRPSY